MLQIPPVAESPLQPLLASLQAGELSECSGWIEPEGALRACCTHCFGGGLASKNGACKVGFTLPAVLELHRCEFVPAAVREGGPHTLPATAVPSLPPPI